MCRRSSCALGVGEAGAVISELGQHPSAEDHAEAGLAGIDLSVPVTAKIAGHHLAQLGDLPGQGADEPDLAGHDRRERRLYLRGLTQRWRSQHRLDCVGFLLTLRRLARRSAAAILDFDTRAARCGSGATASSSRVSAASRSAKASNAAGKNSRSTPRNRSTCLVRSQTKL
jgi:hypothetical protein